MCDEDYHPVEIRYTFYLPDNKDDLTIFQHSTDYYLALMKIYEECRKIWKYDDSDNTALVEFAEKISAIATDTEILEIQ